MSKMAVQNFYILNHYVFAFLLLARKFHSFRQPIYLLKTTGMKKVTAALLAMTVVICACNNESKDSVEKADSANKANIDSPGVKRPVMADEETSSFLVKAANGGMTEVQLGQMAQQKGADQKVKDFAAMMVHDHSAVNEQVKALAAQRNVILPDSISDENKKEMNDLGKKIGRAFDKAYINAMVKGHESTIDLFEKAEEKVNDTEVRTFINNTLPKVRNHLDSAKAIQKSMK
jgi:putative membrane protein